MGSNWTVVKNDSSFCIGLFGEYRKKLEANDPNNCRNVAEVDKDCSGTIYHCSARGIIYCRCVLQNRSCIVASFRNTDQWCTIEQHKTRKSGI